MKIALARRSHNTEDLVGEEIIAWREDGTIISDASALAIAGWFCAPDAPELTALATSGTGDTGALGAAIMREREFFARFSDEGPSLEMLAALDAWVESLEDH